MEIKIILNKISCTHICYDIYNFNDLVGSVTLLANDIHFLDDLFIETRFRRKGIARYLLNFFKIKKLQCTSWNEIGNSFYKALGFKETISNTFLITYERSQLHV